MRLELAVKAVTPPFLAAVMARRAAAGLLVRITGFPERPEPFDYYAKDESDKAEIIRRAQKHGYTVKIVGSTP